MSNYTFFDLFGGIGGFRIGMERAGFKCVGYCDNDKHASMLYRSYFDTREEKHFDDATTINTEELPDFDVLCGGFPCQSFSIAGKQQGFDDQRGQLFFQILRILKDKKPKCILLENVKNLLSHDNGRTFQTILKSLADLGYILQWEVINSKWFLPQNRERVFIVGFLGRECFRQIFPTEIQKRSTSIKINETLTQKGVILSNRDSCYLTDYSNTIDANYQKGIGNQSRTGVLVGTLRTHKLDEGFRTMKNNYCPTIPARGREDGSGQPIIAIPVITPDRVKKRQNGRRFKKNGEPMFTLTGQDIHGVYDGYRIRRLTPLECFRLQGFPDSIVKRAHEINISDAQLYKMAGNAVTVNVVETISNKMMQKFKEVENG